MQEAQLANTPFQRRQPVVQDSARPGVESAFPVMHGEAAVREEAAQVRGAQRSAGQAGIDDDRMAVAHGRRLAPDARGEIVEQGTHRLEGEQ
jgi:hypothetical protein